MNSCPRRSPWSVAADDPITTAFPSRHGDWELLAEHVELHELSDGGHYFVRTRPAEAAAGRTPRSQPVRLLLTGQLKGNRYVVLIHDVTARHRTGSPARLRFCWPRPRRRAGWAAEHRDALRAVVAEHGSDHGPRPRPA